MCSLSGHLPGESCHNQSDTWFIPGKSPISKCLIHRQILISKKDGLRACDEQQGDVRKEIFEFWPSDLLQVFRLAGIPRKGPPAYQKNCSLVETQGIGVAPNITSPKKDVIYTLRVPTGNFVPETPIPLQAVADGDVKKLSWFVGSELVGQSEPQKPLLWKAHPGRFIVRVVDDLGRNDSRELEVKLSQ